VQNKLQISTETESKLKLELISSKEQQFTERNQANLKMDKMTSQIEQKEEKEPPREKNVTVSEQSTQVSMRLDAMDRPSLVSDGFGDDFGRELGNNIDKERIDSNNLHKTLKGEGEKKQSFASKFRQVFRLNESRVLFLMIGGTVLCISALVHLVVISVFLPVPTRVFNETKITQMEQEARRVEGGNKTGQMEKLDNYISYRSVCAVRLLQCIYTISKPCHILATVMCVVSLCSWWFTLYGLKEKTNKLAIMDYVLVAASAIGYMCSAFMAGMWVYALHLFPNIEDIIKSAEIAIEYNQLPSLLLMQLAAVEMWVSFILAVVVISWNAEQRDEAEIAEEGETVPQTIGNIYHI